jgi:DNA-binding response OmpR family regulator
MHRILIIEDEAAMRQGLMDNLQFEGYDVDAVEDGPGGLERLTTGRYDLALLDVMLPGMNGFDVCRKARAAGCLTPIIMLTAKGEEIDTVLGLELGADDYVTKPFRLRELLARVKAVLRRELADASPSEPCEFTIGRLRIDTLAHEATEDGQKVSLSHLEMQVLKYLYAHRGEVVERQRLLQDVWGYEESPATRTVDNFILKLRQKIERDPSSPDHILTVHGVGYRLVV